MGGSGEEGVGLEGGVHSGRLVEQTISYISQP